MHTAPYAANNMATAMYGPGTKAAAGAPVAPAAATAGILPLSAHNPWAPGSSAAAAAAAVDRPFSAPAYGHAGGQQPFGFMAQMDPANWPGNMNMELLHGMAVTRQQAAHTVSFQPADKVTADANTAAGGR